MATSTKYAHMECTTAASISHARSLLWSRGSPHKSQCVCLS